MKKLLLPRLPLFALLGILLSLNSCRVLNPSIMLQAEKDFQYDTLQTDSTVAKEFKLQANDIIEFRLFANDGFKLIDIVASGSGAAGNNLVFRQGLEYNLDNRGTVKLPVLGEEYLAGMTIREAQDYLEKRYAEYYVDPFVLLKVINKRVIVYPGMAGQAKVITLSNNNTSVIEALALAGGISGDGKAYNVKLIRKTENEKKPFKVYKLDLSKIEGLAEGNTIVQSGDIIYVEPRKNLARETLREITPILSLTTSLFTLYFLFSRL